LLNNKYIFFFILSNNFDLLKINLFNDGHEHNFSIDTLQIEKANALNEINDTNNSKIINNNDTKEITSAKEVGLEKDSNKETHDQNEGEDDDDDNLDLKNTTLQNTGLSTTTTTTTTKSSNSIGINNNNNNKIIEQYRRF
jgi:hypothetical protein